MQEFFITQCVYIGRIVAAGICGMLIGRERQKRIKAAGIKTHFIIAVASALMMIISKYGFFDAILSDGTSVDVSRVAAGILAGVGLMGGGLVISGKQGFTSGITTAAGIWATVAIGMALGAGMYITGVSTTLILLLGQFIFHRNAKLAKAFWHGQIDFIIQNEKDDIKSIAFKLEEAGVNLLRIKCDIQNSETQRLKVIFAVPTKKDRTEIVNLIMSIPCVRSYEF